MKKISTSRLILRPLRISDEKAINNNIRSPEVLEHMRILSYPYDESTTLPFITKAISDFELGLQYVYAICIKKNKDPIGIISLTHLDRKNSEAEIYYWLGKDHWHRGYMTEAIGAILDLGFNVLNLREISARVSSANRDSMQLLTKYGFKYKNTIPYGRFKNGKYYDELIYLIRKS
jgi:[ribosomal protein S5]-alanine N-acetyltransferase